MGICAQGHSEKVKGTNDLANFKEMVQGLDEIGFSKEEKSNVFNVRAC